jgi:hypothetical protein
MDFVRVAIEDIGIAGQLILFYFLLRGPLRRYLPIFIYVLVEILGTYADKYADHLGRRTLLFQNVYFGTEVFGDLVLLAVLIFFAYQLMEDSPVRDKVRKLLGIIASAAVILPFLIFRAPLFSTTWYNGTIQLYNFGAAIMTLALWTAVIARKTRDPQLLLVCAGLGIAVAGNAALWGMRKFTSPGSDPRVIANLMIQILYLVRLGIWCWAFRPQHQPPPPAAPASAKA